MKIKALLLFLVIIFGCSNKSRVKPDVFYTDPLINAYELDYRKLYKQQVAEDIKFFLRKYERKWTDVNINKYMTALIIGQQEFNISYKTILAITAIESNFKINIVGHNSSTKDYGLTQQNELYYKERYDVAERILDKYGIEYSNSKFDIYKNVLASYIYLNDLKNNETIKSLYEIIDAYNKGVVGMRRSSCPKYYNKFAKEFFNI